MHIPVYKQKGRHTHTHTHTHKYVRFLSAFLFVLFVCACLNAHPCIRIYVWCTQDEQDVASASNLAGSLLSLARRASGASIANLAVWCVGRTHVSELLADVSHLLDEVGVSLALLPEADVRAVVEEVMSAACCGDEVEEARRHMHACMCTCLHAEIHIFMLTCMHACMHACVHTYTDSYTQHTHTHTHTHPG